MNEKLARETAQVTRRFRELGVYEGPELRHHIREDLRYLRALENLDRLENGELVKIYIEEMRR